MIDFLYEIDVKLFYLINHGMKSPFFDWFMPAYTDYDIYKKILLTLFILFALWWGRKKVLWEIVTAGAGVILCDVVCSQILKKCIARIRPCHVLENVYTIGGCSSSFSMPSNHAANTFCAITVFCLLYPKATFVLLPAGLLLALSRVYLGAHYPSDVLAGMIIGMIFGSTALYLKGRIEKRWVVSKVAEKNGSDEE